MENSKRILFILLLIVVSFGSYSQTWQSNCTSTIVSERLFRNDVYKLATRRILDINSTYKDSFEIPNHFRDSIAKALYAIYNMPSSPIKDTIMYYFGFSDFTSSTYHEYEGDSLHIHHESLSVAGTQYSPKKVELYISKSAGYSWPQQWIAGNYTNTSDSQMNGMMTIYNFTVKTDTAFGPYYHFLLTADRAINTLGVAKRFSTILANGGNTCQAYHYNGDGNTIKLDYTRAGINITFRNGCGDCPAGCSYGKFWKFQINTNSNCSVTYLGDSIFYVFMPRPNGIYYCGRDGSDWVMPVLMRNLIGKVINNKAHLDWDVLTEKDLRYYIVEKSLDGENFVELEKIFASQDNTPVKSYSWNEKVDLNSTIYYRIKAVEKDGHGLYTNIVKLSPTISLIKRPLIFIYPNPTQTNIYLQCAGSENSKNSMVITDIAGRIIAKKQMPPGNFTSAIDIRSLSNGVYLIKLINDNGQSNVKQFVKE